MLSGINRGGYISGDSTKYSQTYSMAFDGFGNMTSVSVGSLNLATCTYGSNNKPLEKMTYGNGDSVEYTYDLLGRVTREDWSSGTTYKVHINMSFCNIIPTFQSEQIHWFSFADRCFLLDTKSLHEPAEALGIQQPKLRF